MENVPEQLLFFYFFPGQKDETIFLGLIFLRTYGPRCELNDNMSNSVGSLVM